MVHICVQARKVVGLRREDSCVENSVIEISFTVSDVDGEVDKDMWD